MMQSRPTPSSSSLPTPHRLMIPIHCVQQINPKPMHWVQQPCSSACPWPVSTCQHYIFRFIFPAIMTNMVLTTFSSHHAYLALQHAHGREVHANAHFKHDEREHGHSGTARHANQDMCERAPAEHQINDPLWGPPLFREEIREETGADHAAEHEEREN